MQFNSNIITITKVLYKYLLSITCKTISTCGLPMFKVYVRMGLPKMSKQKELVALEVNKKVFCAVFKKVSIIKGYLLCHC